MCKNQLEDFDHAAVAGNVTRDAAVAGCGTCEKSWLKKTRDQVSSAKENNVAIKTVEATGTVADASAGLLALTFFSMQPEPSSHPWL